MNITFLKARLLTRGIRKHLRLHPKASPLHRRPLSLVSLKSRAAQLMDEAMDIPYDNFAAENKMYIDEITAELQEVFLLRDEAGQKRYIEGFERMYAAAFDREFAIGVSSGTAALSLSLLSLGVGREDEVITTPHTYIATALAISDAGAKPVFVDIREDFNIDTSKIKDAITPRTKAIVPVHLYGKPCSMDEVGSLAQQHGLFVVEDVCQAHGSAYNEKKAGTFGDAGCFSFHPTKSIGSLGDGGMVITSSRKLAKKISYLREPIHNTDEILVSKRTPACLDPIHIPFLLVKLKHLDEIIAKKSRIADIYNKCFTDVPYVKVPHTDKRCMHSWRNYTLRAENRDNLLKYLLASGIQAKVFYETPLHLRQEFKFLGYKRGDFPVCERLYNEIISLPISYSLPENNAEKIVKEVKKFYGISAQ